MARLKSLTSKSLLRFFIFTAIILLCCFPLLYILMKNIYAEDLDEIIEFRAKQFIENELPSFTIEDINQWNKYNEDVAIIPFDKKYPCGKIQQEEDFSMAEKHDIDYRVLYSSILIGQKPYILRIKVAMIEPHDLLNILLTQYGVLFVTLIISLSVIYIYISKQMWKPFYDTLQKMEQFSLTAGKEPKFEQTDIKEFVNLNERLNKLIRENMNIYRQQKEFVENASHELQTPLAVFQSQLDMLLQQPDLTEVETNIIQSLYSTSSRMSRLNKNLLLLAKMDNEQFEQRESLSFIRALYEQLSPLKELAESNWIKMTVEVNNPLTINANQILLESLISNLIVNAIRHNSKDAGIINMVIKNKTFLISNTGQPEPLNPNKIFRRFSRTSEKKEGNGLGLSIVRQICKLHGWNVKYDFINQEHVFTVIFE